MEPPELSLELTNPGKLWLDKKGLRQGGDQEQLL